MLKIIVSALVAAAPVSGNHSLVSGEITLLLVIIGAIAIILGVLITERALPRITRNSGELPRSMWEVKNVGGVLYATHVLAYESSRGRPDECKPGGEKARGEV